MSNFRLSRRTVLRGAGTIAIALPWLEAMTSDRRRAHAATFSAPARRFLAVYQPGGTILQRWRPTGTETAFTLSPILAPFSPVQSSLLVLDGLDMVCALSGEQVQGGIIGFLTGSRQATTGPGFFATGPSIDQILTGLLGGAHKKASLEMAIRWGTGRALGRVTAIDIANFQNVPGFAPLPPAIDPVTIWQDLFGTVGSSFNATWDKSILDFVDRRYVALAARLGAADRQRLEQHLTKVRELEQEIAITGRCAAPPLANTSDYNPRAGLTQDVLGLPVDLATDAAIPKVGKLMMDMMVMAFACDLTAIGTLQWGDVDARYTLPWLNLRENHYYYQNGGGFHPAECEQIATWYSTQHSYLLQEMAKVDVGGHSLLDESVVFFGTEVQNPADHSKSNVPFLLAGGGGGLRSGRWVTYDHLPHNNLLVSILNLFGLARTTIGNPLDCTGPLTNLT